MASARGLADSLTRSSRAAGSASPLSFDRFDARVVAVFGAFAIGLTGPLLDLSGASASTASFYRALFAAGLLAAARWFVGRGRVRRGARPVPRRSRAERLTAWLAGICLGLDMVLWTTSVLTVGAGIATVVVNVQVVVVPVVSLVAFGERLRRSFWLLAPVLLGGVGLAGGVLGGGEGSAAPWYGTLMGAGAGVAYSGYLLLLRRSSAEPAHRVANLTDVMMAAAGVGLVAGLVTGNLDPTPGWSALGWLVLVAVTGQVLAWLLLGSALPRLAASTGSVLLLIQPVFALGLSAALLGQKPTPVQLIGCAIVLAAVVLLSRREQHPGKTHPASDQRQHVRARCEPPTSSWGEAGRRQRSIPETWGNSIRR
jgi:drug/metabolite transporter (DMT)-like permease